ncbi:uncharacterized protein LOC113358997 [Papaver somniferum]|uniref:uncharacterized protein LOC113358997 n=1 Tax=Papaver somniferum TaxID=3469 RepID=UPI000E6F5E7F|nr:uncharacterized protein LOC113358997 [Papaver somniferum]
MGFDQGVPFRCPQTAPDDSLPAILDYNVFAPDKSIPFLLSERKPVTTTKYNVFWQDDFIAIHQFVQDVVTKPRETPSSAGLDNSNIFARLAHGQKAAPLEEGDDKTESLEEESEEEENSRSGGERSTSECNRESSSIGITNESEKAIEDNPEMEIRRDEDVVLPPTMEVVPASNLEMEIVHREDVATFQMTENSPMVAGLSEIQRLQAEPVDGPSADFINQQEAEVEKFTYTSEEMINVVPLYAAGLKDTFNVMDANRKLLEAALRQKKLAEMESLRSQLQQEQERARGLEKQLDETKGTDSKLYYL